MHLVLQGEDISGIRLGICVTAFAAALGLAGCQEEKPVVKLDDALRTTAQFRLGQEMAAPAQQPPASAPRPAQNFWTEVEGGEIEIETVDISDAEAQFPQARALYRNVMQGGARVSPVQRIRQLERVLSLIEADRSRAATNLRRDARFALAHAFNVVNDMRAATASMKEAVRLFEATKTVNGRYLGALHSAGLFAATVNDLATAEAMLTRARAVETQLGAEKEGLRLQPLNRARVVYLDGWIAFIKRDNAGSVERLRAALAGFEEMQARRAQDPSLGNFSGEIAGVQSRLSRPLAGMGRLAEAETALLESMRLYGELYGRNSSQVAGLLRLLATSYSRQGRLSEREKAAADAVAILEAIGRTDASFDLNMARLVHAGALAAQLRNDEALAQFDKAYGALRQHAPGQLYVGFQTNYLSLLSRSGRAGEALRMADGYVQALTRSAGTDSMDMAVGRAYRAIAKARLRDHRGALDEFRDVMPRIFADGDLVVDEELGTTGLEVVRHNLAIEFLDVSVAMSVAEPAERDRVLREAFTVAERLRLGGTARALAAAAERQAVRDPAVADLIRRDQNAGLEHSRLLRRIAELNRGQLDESERAEIAAARQRVGELDTARRTLRAAISQRDPSFAARTSTQVSSLDDVRAVLAEDEAMLALYVSGPKTYVWAFRRSGPIGFAVADLPLPRVRGMVDTLRKPVDTPVTELRDIPPFDTGVAYGLYRDLLLPVGAGWEGARTLVVVSHGPLAQIPFHMLVTAPTQIGADKRVLFDRYAKVPFLARTAAVAQVPSATSLVQLRAAPLSSAVAREPFVGFGDALFNQRQAADAARQSAAVQTRGGERFALRSVRTTEDGRPFDAIETRSRIFGGLARLPETADELRAVATALGADPAKDVFLGIEANETRVRTMDLSRKRIVMFATHGLLAGDLPGLTQPALALTSPDVAKVDGDGLLTLDNIMGLRLNADWVVLSACNTAGGDGANAEAISGLGRAFFFAGARALLVTNWAVETSSAQALTTTLFREQAAGATRGEALRKTMVGMIEHGVYTSPTTGRPLFSYAYPLFWAPYSLIGDPASSQPGS